MRTSAIEVERVTKAYTIRHERKRTLKEQLLGQYGAREKVEALREVTFSVAPGETFGIVGANGSGKSTLLKLLAGTARPTSGTVNVAGRVSALLELGAGFHPDFTGRENVYLNASLLGLSRADTDAALPAIVDFAELGDFFDAAVKTYSSGMYTRLAFAVAAHVEPDVLLVDEILAVGDEYFQRKCYAKINDFRARGKTICFVSHDLGAVARLCQRGLLLDRGQVVAEGEIKRVLDAYAIAVDAHEQGTLASAPRGERWGSGEVRIVSASVHQGGDATLVVRTGEAFEIRLGWESDLELADVVFGITLYRDDGVSIYGTHTKHDGLVVPVRAGAGRVSFCVERLPLLPGRYELDVAAVSATMTPYDYHSKRLSFRVTGASGEMGTTRLEHRWEISS